ncbi:FAD-binding protein [Lentzea sp. NPDC006480]|uniref:FAD-binding protein n=1 Tax=Lentzea sp. NPDC006480 TaxID=3157176 RepID=UPI0033BF5984
MQLTLTGTLDTDNDTLTWAARDYGDTIHHRPNAVLRPGDPTDISTVVRYAHLHGVPVVPRGAGHSTGGQSQAPGGIVIDMTCLSTIHEIGFDRVVVDAGARWSDIVRATLPHGLTPPVLTDYLELTVGGTLSVGGLGGASHHHGAQTDHVLALDVVTPTGELISCNPHENRELFVAVRAGRGRNGIITRATLRLIPAPETVVWHKLRYDAIDELVADQRLLVTTDAFNYVEGQLKVRGGRFVAELEAVSFAGSRSGQLTDLHPQDGETDTVTYWDFVNRLTTAEPLLREAGLWDSPHPWCNVIVPDKAAEEVLRGLGGKLGSTLYSDFGLVLAYPLRADRITTPLLRLPHDRLVFLIAALRYAPTDAPDIVAAMEQANDALIAVARQAGGTLYLDPL